MMDKPMLGLSMVPVVRWNMPMSMMSMFQPLLTVTAKPYGAPRVLLELVSDTHESGR